MSLFPPDREHARDVAGKRFLGGVLMAAGGMVAGLCGLCTLYLSFGVVVSAIRYHGSLNVLILPLVIGGFPTVMGIGVFFTGLRLYRSTRRKRGQPWREFE